MKTFFIFLSLQSLLVYKETQGLDITAFIEPCSAKDPNLNDCVKETAKKFIPQIAKGVTEWNVPSLDPLVTSEMSFTDHKGDNSLDINYKNIIQTGFSGVLIESADVDLAHGVMNLKLKYPYFTFGADYTAKGKFYTFDVDGSGTANISVWNAYSSFVLKYHVVSDHIKQDSLIIGFSFDKIYLDYTNLILNGDKELSESAVRFLNENSREIIEAFKPELEKFYISITKEFLQTFFDAVPYSVLFKKD